ncbi:MAG: GIY-YIG nuclease family protein [Winogradskyella sp.]|uniref:GIY-YIG nuclease family protein n=1 Tax=Winogradskyella sp. TaxID=1883156 RepID=UPI00179CADA6|nr:GIY-YIG nuclease family protein [Winogradskyella sp.]
MFREKHNLWCVYILKCIDATYYTGCTGNLNNRIAVHKSGKVKYTSDRLPIALVFYCVFPDKYKAYKFEKYLKSGSGKAFANKRFL